MILPNSTATSSPTMRENPRTEQMNCSSPERSCLHTSKKTTYTSVPHAKPCH